VWRTVASIALATVLLLAGRRIAYAHATLVSAEPAAGSHLSRTPSRIRLLFSEEIEAGLASLSVVAADGHATRLAVESDPHDVRALVAPLSELAPGGYRLLWHVVSADGHPVEGNLVFWVGAGSHAAPPAISADAETAPAWGVALGGAPVVPALARGVALSVLLALAGVLWFVSAGGTSADRAALRLARVLALAAPLLLAFHLLMWLVNEAPEHRITGEAISAGLASGVGRVELWRTGAALLAAWALWLARRERLALAFAAAALLLSGATGHAAALHPAVAIPAKALHLAAGAAWIGGLLWLLSRDRTDVERFSRDASRVSSVALAAVVLVTASGVVQGLLFLPSPLDAFRSAYGAVTLAKVAGLVVLVAFGAHHRYRVLPRLTSSPGIPNRFAVTLRRELLVLVVVALLGGLLAYTPPPPHHPSPETVSRP
jgi:copper transport protein